MKRLKHIDAEAVFMAVILVLIHAVLIPGFIAVLSGCATTQPVGPYVDCTTVYQHDQGGLWEETDTGFVKR